MAALALLLACFLFALLVFTKELAAQQEQEQFASLSEAQKALRTKLLEDYDRGVLPPTQYLPYEGNGSLLNGTRVAMPVTVEIGINFHRVLDVDVIKSSVDLLSWLRLVWVDERLAWNPEDYGGVDKLWFWIGDGIGLGKFSA